MLNSHNLKFQHKYLPIFTRIICTLFQYINDLNLKMKNRSELRPKTTEVNNIVIKLMHRLASRPFFGILSSKL